MGTRRCRQVLTAASHRYVAIARRPSLSDALNSPRRPPSPSSPLSNVAELVQNEPAVLPQLAPARCLPRARVPPARTDLPAANAGPTAPTPPPPALSLRSSIERRRARSKRAGRSSSTRARPRPATRLRPTCPHRPPRHERGSDGPNAITARPLPSLLYRTPPCSSQTSRLFFVNSRPPAACQAPASHSPAQTSPLRMRIRCPPTLSTRTLSLLTLLEHRLAC